MHHATVASRATAHEPLDATCLTSQHPEELLPALPLLSCANFDRLRELESLSCFATRALAALTSQTLDSLVSCPPSQTISSQSLPSRRCAYPRCETASSSNSLAKRMRQPRADLVLLDLQSQRPDQRSHSHNSRSTPRYYPRITAAFTLTLRID